MYFLYMFLSVLSIVVLLLPGYFLKRSGVLSGGAAKDFSALLLYVGIPALSVYCVMGVDIKQIPPLNILLCVALAVAIHFIPYLFLLPVLRNCPDRKAAVATKFGAMFSNCGFMGIPVATLAVTFSPAGEPAVKEALFYVTIFNIIFNIISWTFGLGMYSSGESRGYILKKALLSPCIIATVLSLPFLFTGVSLLNPIVIGDVTVSQIASVILYLYNICVPVSMIILGIRLADVSPRDLFSNRYVYLCGLAKLVVTPAAAIGLMALTALFAELSPAFVIALTVMAAAPPATNGLAFAETYGGDTKTAGAGILLCTIASIATVPLFLMAATALI